MKRLIILMFNILLHYHICWGQWQSLGGGLGMGVGPGSGYSLFYDSISTKLYVAGVFDSADGIPTSGIASWDGVQWDSLGHGSLPGPIIYTVAGYGNKIIVGGGIFYGSPGHPYLYNATWDGVAWDTTGVTADSPYNVYKIYNGDLYVGGAFTEVDHQPANLLARYDGTQFYPYFLPSEAGGYDVRAIEFYQGYMYVGGNFYDTITGTNDLERWNGTNFEPFGGGGLAFGGDAITGLQVFQNELYIGGNFRQSTGSPGNGIMKWDGNTFNNLGGGANSFIYRMKVYNNELYVSGGFTQIGGSNITYMAKWNGTVWSPVVSNFFCNCIRDFEFIGNDLFIVGNFDTIDGVHTPGIAKYANAVNSVGPVNSNQFMIYPNPVMDHLSLMLDGYQTDEVVLYDMAGKELVRQKPIDLFVNIDMKEFEPGLYFLLIRNKSGNYIKKIVKE